MNTPQSLPYINDLLRPLSRPASQLDNSRALEKYLKEFIVLYEGDHRLVLSGEFLTGMIRGKNIEEWLRGTEKNPQKLRSLCYDPVVSRQGNTVSIRYNVISAAGKIAQWTVKAKVGKTIEIIGVTTKQLRGPGTFFWPLVC